MGNRVREEEMGPDREGEIGKGRWARIRNGK